jgi:hypothetical protein
MTMWQKARILANNSFPEVIGREIWTLCEPPHMTAAISAKDGTYRPERLSMKIAIKPIDPHAPYCVLPMAKLELLPEFAEDVPLISWDDFLKGDAIESGASRVHMAKGGFQR